MQLKFAAGILSLIFAIVGFDVVVAQTSESSNNIVFDLPDLNSFARGADGDFVQLEAYKSVENDRIINGRLVSEYGKLNWVSVGDPTLILSANFSDKEVFHFTEEGFYTYIEMLTNEHRNLMVQAAKKKYNIDVFQHQILNLVLSRFQCKIRLYIGDSSTIINGNVYNFRKFPLKMEFWAPKGTAERELFIQRLGYSNDDVSADINLECEMSSRGKEVKTNSLTITSQQLLNLDVSDRLFGDASTTSVTRSQLSDLGAELYASLNVVEEYQIPMYAFTDEFVNGIIKQVSDVSFAPVPFDQALATLSKYSTDIRGDIKPDVITSDMGKLFEIKKEGNFQSIKVNQETLDIYNETQKVGTSVGGKVSVEGKFSVGGSVAVSNEKNKEWTESKASLAQQIKDLNTENQNDVEWEIKGEKIVPKSLNVAVLSKAAFSKTLTFSRIRKQSYDAPYQRKISMYTTKILSKPNIRRHPLGTIAGVSSSDYLKSFDQNGKGLNNYLGWYLCDGRNGAPDLRGRFLVGYSNNTSDYNAIGKTGGLEKVRLTIAEMPSHTHGDNGHSHSFSIDSAASGNHNHEYKDIFHSEFSGMGGSDYTDTPSRMGSSYSDYDNYGHQMQRVTDSNGAHTHRLDGETGIGQLNLSFNGGESHENRQAYYVVAFAIFLDL